MPTRIIKAGDRSTAVRITEKFREKEWPFFWPLIGDYPLYDRYIYAVMIADEEREAVYRKAIGRRCRDKIVIDVGTGDTAIWARAAAEAGARRVYAIEENSVSVARARKLVSEAGWDSVIEILEGRSDALEVRERGDVMISEVIGEVGGSEGTAAILNDVRERWLKAGAESIPSRCVSWMCPVSLPASVSGEPELERMGLRYLEQIFELAGGPFDVRLSLDNCFEALEEGKLAEAAVMEDLNFDERCPVEGQVVNSFGVERSGRFDGLLIWIELFADDQSPAISSMVAGSNWRPVFVPLFSPGIDVVAGDRIEVRWETRLSSNGLHPDYEVEAQVHRSHQAEAEADAPPCSRLRLPRFGTSDDFRQNEFYRKLFPDPGE